MAGTVTRAGTTPLTARSTWIQTTWGVGTTTQEGGAVGGARREPPRALTGPGGTAAEGELWTPAPNVSGTTAEDEAPGTDIAWRRSTSEEKEEEEEEGGTGAGTG